MSLNPLSDGNAFKGFSMLYMNDVGQYIEPRKDVKHYSDAQAIRTTQLPSYFKKRIALPKDVTDVFVWVHGWRNNTDRALATARRIFNGIAEVHRMYTGNFNHLANFVPGFVAVHWPSMSSPLRSGYKLIRDRAKELTDDGDAELNGTSLRQKSL
jgi:hypothetical protein